MSNLLKGLGRHAIVWCGEEFIAQNLNYCEIQDEFRRNMAVMLTYRCCYDIIKNKERQVNDMKLFIRDNGNSCHSHLCF